MHPDGLGLRHPQEAVDHTLRVEVVSGDHPQVVVLERQGALAGFGAGAWSVERGDGAARSPQEAVIYTARVDVVSGNRPQIVEAVKRGPLAGFGAGAWSAVCGDGAVRSPQEAVTHTARVDVPSGNRPLRLMPFGVAVKVPWPAPLPAPGALYVVMAPSGARSKL